jgi:hypothetical protein
VQLSQSKELQDLLWLWGKLVDTLNSDNECNLWLGFNEEATGGFGVSSSLDQCGISGIVLVEVFLCESVLFLSGFGSLGLVGGSLVLFSLKQSCISTLLFENVFWNNPCSEFIQKYRVSVFNHMITYFPICPFA